MATMVYYEGVWEYDNKTHIFRTPDGEPIFVTSFENCVATIDPLVGSHIKKVARIVAGCFDKKSNFKELLMIAFSEYHNEELKAIQFKFNDINIVVTKENANEEEIYATWKRAEEESCREAQREWEEYIKTPEYKAKRAKELKKETRLQEVQKEVVFVEKSTRLRFKDKEAAKLWKKYVRVNSKDDYGKIIIMYARYWAKYMQHIMKKHNKTISEIAGETSHACDIDYVTGYMHGCAVFLLASCWKYGEELRKWHNKEWGNEDCDGVINPAIINIKVD